MTGDRLVVVGRSELADALAYIEAFDQVVASNIREAVDAGAILLESASAPSLVPDPPSLTDWKAEADARESRALMGGRLRHLAHLGQTSRALERRRRRSKLARASRKGRR